MGHHWHHLSDFSSISLFNRSRMQEGVQEGQPHKKENLKEKDNLQKKSPLKGQEGATSRTWNWSNRWRWWQGPGAPAGPLPHMQRCPGTPAPWAAPALWFFSSSAAAANRWAENIMIWIWELWAEQNQRMSTCCMQHAGKANEGSPVAWAPTQGCVKFYMKRFCWWFRRITNWNFLWPHEQILTKSRILLLSQLSAGGSMKSIFILKTLKLQHNKEKTLIQRLRCLTDIGSWIVDWWLVALWYPNANSSSNNYNLIVTGGKGKAVAGNGEMASIVRINLIVTHSINQSHHARVMSANRTESSNQIKSHPWSMVHPLSSSKSNQCSMIIISISFHH